MIGYGSWTTIQLFLCAIDSINKINEMNDQKETNKNKSQKWLN